MTLNGAIALILFFSPNLTALQADYVTMVEDRPIMSIKYCLPDPVFHFWPKLTHPAARSVCDNWATCMVTGNSAVLFLPRCMCCMQRGLATRKLSVCPSVKHVHSDKTEERSIQIFILYETSFSLVFRKKEWLVGSDLFTWNFGSSWSHWNEIADFQSIFARSASAVAPVKKSLINTNRKTTLRFPMSIRWTSYIAPKPPKGAQKCKTAVFHVKSHSISVIVSQS